MREQDVADGGVVLSEGRAHGGGIIVPARRRAFDVAKQKGDRSGGNGRRRLHPRRGTVHRSERSRRLPAAPVLEAPALPEPRGGGAKANGMNAETLRAVQAPIKDRYRTDPAAATVTLTAVGRLDDPEGLSCSVETGRALVTAGLHPATGGDGLLACSGDMLLQALVACAGVTLRAVATATDIPVRGGSVHAAGDLDFRGTLGVDRDAPVGFRDIRLTFELETDATPEQLATLQKLTERYCVVYQTLAGGVRPQTAYTVHATAP